MLSLVKLMKGLNVRVKTRLYWYDMSANKLLTSSHECRSNDSDRTKLLNAHSIIDNRLLPITFAFLRFNSMFGLISSTDSTTWQNYSIATKFSPFTKFTCTILSITNPIYTRNVMWTEQRKWQNFQNFPTFPINSTWRLEL